VPAASVPQARAVLQGLYKAFWETDASLAEINPLILTGDGRVVALDAKMNFDSNALFRHPDILELRDLDEEDPAEIESKSKIAVARMVQASASPPTTTAVACVPGRRRMNRVSVSDFKNRRCSGKYRSSVWWIR
jgi:hypothetical protein